MRIYPAVAPQKLMGALLKKLLSCTAARTNSVSKLANFSVQATTNFNRLHAESLTGAAGLKHYSGKGKTKIINT